ncbi:MAG: hypothetical protein AB8F65_02280 [Woeseiaceae bacterium]
MSYGSRHTEVAVRDTLAITENRPRPKSWVLAVLLGFLSSTWVLAGSAPSSIAYGDRVATLSEPLSRLLAEKDQPNAAGAMGRNRRAYFHVRFQLGLHNLMNYGIVAQDERAFDAFVSAVEYAFNHQTEAGDFRIFLPPELEGQVEPGLTDLASGTAFFAASLGSALYAWDTSDWVQSAPELLDRRRRLIELNPSLEKMLSYLLDNHTRLMTADQNAPNRLLFTAVALQSLGLRLDSADALEGARAFVDQALSQLAPEGYFIEGGGYDSSYNGVATSLAIRLLMMGYQEEALASAASDALQWQRRKILATGEISTAGNTRVNPNAGETFLGRKKDVDVGQTIEALMMGSVYFDDRSYLAIAESVVRFYR